VNPDAQSVVLALLAVLVGALASYGGSYSLERRRESRIRNLRIHGLLLDIVRWSEACRVAAVEGRLTVENRTGLRWGDPLLERIAALPVGLRNKASLLYLNRDKTERAIDDSASPDVPQDLMRRTLFELARWHVMADEFIKDAAAYLGQSWIRRLTLRHPETRADLVDARTDEWLERADRRLVADFKFQLEDGALPGAVQAIADRIEAFERLRRENSAAQGRGGDAR